MATAGVLPAALVTDEGLLRGLTRFHALAIVVGAVLGTGIYLRPALVAQQVHSPGRFWTQKRTRSAVHNGTSGRRIAGIRGPDTTSASSRRKPEG